ncbi:glutaminase [uncultured Thiothrix sp.]|uniref:glutaminase n=1 Tax=uncultured Thiothrix sp. TaxID=223185 RepID=UPI00261D62DB|nr:glutaminase [uncultured Thiothrix sp.]
MDYSALIHNVYKQCQREADEGKVASYIPELAKVDGSQFGICLATVDGKEYYVGDASTKFSIQSIVKVFALAMVYQKVDELLWTRVGVEPSGGPFNSLALLEFEQGIPRNPFINAGALVLTDILISKWEDPKQAVLAFIRKLANEPQIGFNEAVASSEATTGYRNGASVALMKSFGNINNDFFSVLDVYFHLCSVEMTCRELARAFLVFSNGGRDITTKQNILSARQVKRINALMQVCGFYDESGDFAFRVGLPGKSGVGGGMVAVYPGKFAVVVWSPPLNAKGNSVRGLSVLEKITTQLGDSIF